MFKIMVGNSEKKKLIHDLLSDSNIIFLAAQAAQRFPQLTNEFKIQNLSNLALCNCQVKNIAKLSLSPSSAWLS